MFELSSQNPLPSGVVGIDKLKLNRILDTAKSDLLVSVTQIN
jgi:hypothetical protein